MRAEQTPSFHPMRSPLHSLFVMTCLLAMTCLLTALRPCAADETPDPYDDLYDIIMTRRSADGKTHGQNHAAPLLWNNSRYLLKGDTHQKFMAALDRFSALSQPRIKRYSDLQRAILQHHLWAVFDWSTSPKPSGAQGESTLTTAARLSIQTKSIALMKRLALSTEKIEKLPSPFFDAIAKGTFSSRFNPADPLAPFLPSHLINPKGPWVCLGVRRNLLPAKAHSEAKEWRSTFLVFARVPGDRKATLAYLKRLNEFKPTLVVKSDKIRENPETPQPPPRTQFAIVEQAMLLNDHGRPVLSPLVLNIQLRAHMADDERGLAEFVLEPRQLMAGKPGLRAIGRDEQHFATFATADPFETRRPGIQIPRLQRCVRCHAREGIFSVNTRSRIFPSGMIRPLRLEETSADRIAQLTAHEKKKDHTWGALEVLWRQLPETR